MAKTKIRKLKKSVKDRERADLLKRFAKALKSETSVRIKEVSRA